MDQKVKIGLTLLSISAFLYATKHITAAIMITNMNNERVNYFDGGYEAVGWGITIWTTLSCITGLLFFLIGIWSTYLLPLLQNYNQQKR